MHAPEHTHTHTHAHVRILRRESGRCALALLLPPLLPLPLVMLMPPKTYAMLPLALACQGGQHVRVAGMSGWQAYQGGRHVRAGMSGWQACQGGRQCGMLAQRESGTQACSLAFCITPEASLLELGRTSTVFWSCAHNFAHARACRGVRTCVCVLVGVYERTRAHAPVCAPVCAPVWESAPSCLSQSHTNNAQKMSAHICVCVCLQVCANVWLDRPETFDSLDTLFAGPWL